MHRVRPTSLSWVRRFAASVVPTVNAPIRRRRTARAVVPAEPASESMSEHAASSVSKSPTDTPMMQQYFALKKQNPDHLLLFRIGGFYELFDEDARIAADRLGITLTKKNDILMCGFPHFALDTYLARLIVGGGHLVAVCEQTETPSDARRRGVGAIHREIRRIVSPGTLIEDSLLQPKSANYLLAVSIEAEQAGFACIDVSTGEMRVSVVNASQMDEELSRLQPREILLSARSSSSPAEQTLQNRAQTRGIALSRSPIVESDRKWGLTSLHTLLPNAGAEIDQLPACVFESVALLARFLRRTMRVHLTSADGNEIQIALDNLNSDSASDSNVAVVSKSKQKPIPPPAAAPISRLHVQLSIDHSFGGQASDAQTSSATWRFSRPMRIDAAARRTLELTQPLSARSESAGPGYRRAEVASSSPVLDLAAPLTSRQASSSSQHTLLGSLDRCVTAAGSRLLAAHLSAPLTEISAINDRLDVVSFFHDRVSVTRAVRKELDTCQDIERCLQRLSLGRGGPRDLLAVAQTLLCARRVFSELGTSELGLLATDTQALRMPGFVSSPKPVTSGSSTLVEQHKLPKLLSNFAAQLNQSDLYSWATQAVKAIRSDVPAGPVDTTLPAFDQQQVTIISSGFSAELDALRAVHADQTTQIAHLQDDFRQRLNCEHARIVNAGIFGLLLELPRSHLVATDAASALELNECVDASTKTARRFSSKSLSLVQQQSHQALAAAFRLELQLWQQLVDQLIAQAAHALAAARALAGIDVSVTLADVAKQRGYVRPQLTTSIELDIRGGQHPMVSASDAARAYFAPNDCVMMPHEGRFWLLTGPNMAGKSTFLRQTALLCIMAQAGSFVPAVSARIGIIDQIMTRAGSSDNLVADQSTFMVEMLETAHILNRATRSSLVIMDEVGRGTATQDGFALAAAVCEHLHDVIGCRTIFATHLHDLHATLKDRVEAGSLVCKAVPAQLAADGSLLFPHKVVNGIVTQSYGVAVARLAGLPASVTARAQLLLEQQQQDSAVASPKPIVTSHQISPSVNSAADQLMTDLKRLHIDDLTPRGALEELYRLRKMVNTPL